MKQQLLKACHWAMQYRTARYIAYALVYCIYVPMRYVLAYTLGWIAVVLEETRDITADLVLEYKTLAHIIRQERKNAKHDG